jgi:hypothetical protein
MTKDHTSPASTAGSGAPAPAGEAPSRDETIPVRPEGFNGCYSPITPPRGETPAPPVPLPDDLAAMEAAVAAEYASEVGLMPLEPAPVAGDVEALAKGLEAYVVGHGGLHDDDCPGDDTCECSWAPANDAANAACRYFAALSKEAQRHAR